MGLSFYRQATDMGYDIIAFQNESWDELASSWNARESFLLTPNPIELAGRLDGNGSDDVVQVNLGSMVYGTMDDIGDHYGNKVLGMGLIKQWDVTDLVKAWVGGRKNVEYAMAVRNRLDADCPRCSSGCAGHVAPVYGDSLLVEGHHHLRLQPLSGMQRGNDDPWPPIPPQIVIELGSDEMDGDLTGFDGSRLDGVPDDAVDTIWHRLHARADQQRDA